MLTSLLEDYSSSTLSFHTFPVFDQNCGSCSRQSRDRKNDRCTCTCILVVRVRVRACIRDMEKEHTQETQMLRDQEEVDVLSECQKGTLQLEDMEYYFRYSPEANRCHSKLSDLVHKVQWILKTMLASPMMSVYVLREREREREAPQHSREHIPKQIRSQIDSSLRILQQSRI